MVVCLSFLFIPFLAVPDATANLVRTPNWAVKCDKDNKCELTISKGDQNGTIAHLTIYDVGKVRIVEYLVPLRVNLKKGVSFVIDQKQSFSTTSLYCDRPGCIGYANLDQSLVKAMRNGKTIELVFQGINEQQLYSIPFTLDGFTAAEQDFQTKTR